MAGVMITDPNLDQHTQQRIEIATRLMEAWLKGGKPEYATVEEMAEQCATAANRIQQKA